MDGSFLSDADVIAASRDFVCVRLLTYEDREEAAFLESVFVGRQGTLENTVFTILAPDGETDLIRAGRTPSMVFGGDGAAEIAEMASTMREIAARYDPRDSDRELPLVVDVRRALDVAACDLLPLVVAIGTDDALEDELTRLAWSDGFIGRFIYVCADSTAAIADAPDGPAVIVVQPDRYGLEGTVLAEAREAGDVAGALRQGIDRHRADRLDERRHISEGRRAGVDWETEVPVTDPGPPDGRRP